MSLAEQIRTMKPSKDACITGDTDHELPAAIKVINKAYNLGFSHAARNAAEMIEGVSDDITKVRQVAKVAQAETKKALEELERLQKFKQLVHDKLDAMRVPTFKGQKINCRISKRLEHVERALDEADKLAQMVMLIKDWAALETEEAELRRLPAGDKAVTAWQAFEEKRQATRQRMEGYQCDDT